MQDKELFGLCKQVHEKTKWDGTDFTYWGWFDSYPDIVITSEVNEKFTKKEDYRVPLYTSDYLLEKLPPVIQDPDDKIFKHIQIWINGDKSTHAGYVEPYAHDDKVAYAQESDKMCKTLLKLTSALLEAGELKLESSSNE